MRKDYVKPSFQKAPISLQTITAIPVNSKVERSDMRLKTDINRVGETPNGLPLYRFRYLGGEERYEGVMAQDVAQIMPQAVLRGADGYYRVDYGMLGISMRRV